MTIVLLVPMIAYLVGSIPVGFLIARCYGIEDIRLHGSGNIGATNVARILGAPFFFVVFFLDAFKAFSFLYLAAHYGASYTILIISALAILIGNGCSVFLQFHGGKSIATSCGIVLFLYPSLIKFAMPMWIIAFLITRTVGIASVIGLFSLPFVGWYYNVSRELFLLLWFIAVWGVWLHRANIMNYIAMMMENQSEV